MVTSGKHEAWIKGLRRGAPQNKYSKTPPTTPPPIHQAYPKSEPKPFILQARHVISQESGFQDISFTNLPLPKKFLEKKE